MIPKVIFYNDILKLTKTQRGISKDNKLFMPFRHHLPISEKLFVFPRNTMLCKALKGEKKIKSARANAQAQKSQKKEDSFYRAVTT